MIGSLIYLIVFSILKLTEVIYREKILDFFIGVLIMVLLNGYNLYKHKNESRFIFKNVKKYLYLNLLMLLIVLISLFNQFILAGVILIALDMFLVHLSILGVSKANNYIQKKL